MDKEDFMLFIDEEFELDGGAAWRLLSNICDFIKRHAYTEVEQYTIACELLDGTIGLSDAELRKICF